MNKLMGYLIFANIGLMVMSSLPAIANKQLKSERFKMNSGHELSFRLIDYGEPVSRPLRIEMDILCKGEKNIKKIEPIYLCKFQKRSFDSSTGELIIFYGSPHVDETGNSKCSHLESTEILISKSCR